MNEYQKLMACLKNVRAKTDFVPEVALILGSGLGNFAGAVEATCILPYGEIEGFPVSTVSGHKGRFVFGHLAGVPVVVMQGRVHYYEGYSMQDVVLPTRLMGLMGAKALVLTNAAGGANWEYRAGDFMLIADHIASFVPSPLVGPNMAELGPRFPDMSEVYDRTLRDIVKRVARALDIPLREGVYVQLTGPQFETPFEVRMCRALGADAIGMSTACEAIAAHHMGMRVCGISCISNLCSGMTKEALSAEEVDETAGRVAPQFQALITRAVVDMAEAL